MLMLLAAFAIAAAAATATKTAADSTVASTTFAVFATNIAAEDDATSY